MKKTIFLIISLILPFILYSQNETDALRFSRNIWFGTDRSLAMGSSFGALGPDMYSMVINPAGIGYYKKSELEMSMGLYSNNTFSNFADNNLKDIKYAFKFNSAGIIFNWKTDLENQNGFIFGVAYNKINNFSQRISISGINNKGSMIDYFHAMAEGLTPEQLDLFSTRLAFDAYLLDTLPGATVNYTNPLAAVSNNNPSYGETQTYSADIAGNMGEWNIALAYDLNDIVSFGASLNLVTGSYNFLSYYSESDFKDTTDLSSFTYNIYNDVSISGLNFKFGILFTPVKFLRVGMAMHSPTYLSLTDKYKTSLMSDWKTPDAEGNTSYSCSSTLNYFDYNITTPFRAIGSLGFVIGKFLALNGEYEFVDYSAITMSSDTYSFFDENQAIRQNFTVTTNYRFGAEFKLSAFYFRAGYAYYGSPYSPNLSRLPEDKTFYSGGFGARTEDFFIDFAVRLGQWSQTYNIYDGYQDEPVPTLKNQSLFVSFGGGVRF